MYSLRPHHGLHARTARCCHGHGAAQFIQFISDLTLAPPFLLAQVVVSSLVASMPALLDVSMVMALYFAIFGTMCVLLFGGALRHRCADPDFSQAYTDERGFVQWVCVGVVAGAWSCRGMVLQGHGLAGPLACRGIDAVQLVMQHNGGAGEAPSFARTHSQMPTACSTGRERPAPGVRYIVPDADKGDICKNTPTQDVRWRNSTDPGTGRIELTPTHTETSLHGWAYDCDFRPSEEHPYGQFCAPFKNPGAEGFPDHVPGFNSFDNILESWIAVFQHAVACISPLILGPCPVCPTGKSSGYIQQDITRTQRLRLCRSSLGASLARRQALLTRACPSHYVCVTATDWAFVMYEVQDGVNWWTWILHFFMNFMGAMLLM
eukprot:800917-Pelagomonas_calceolata.AAC.4